MSETRKWLLRPPQVPGEFSDTDRPIVSTGPPVDTFIETVEASAVVALTDPGDTLQSAASRMAEWIRALDPNTVPYEVSMAALEARSAVDEWTEARREKVSP